MIGRTSDRALCSIDKFIIACGYTSSGDEVIRRRITRTEIKVKTLITTVGGTFGKATTADSISHGIRRKKTEENQEEETTHKIEVTV